MATTTISIVKRSEFGEMAKIGTLMYPAKYYDARHNCDLKKLRKAVPELTGQRIFKILIMTDKHRAFTNDVNEKITYKNAMFCDESHPMKRVSNFGYYECDHPVGNVIIVVCG